MHLFAKVNTPLFYTPEGKPVAALSMPQQYVPHRMGYYRRHDYLGVATGGLQWDRKGRLQRREVELRYLYWWQWAEGMPPRALTGRVRLWVDAEDVATRQQVGFRYANPLARAMSRLRVAGQMLWSKRHE